MSSVDYDLDANGGLMPKIQALIAPPESDETGKSSKKKEGLDLHPYYKRPGKGHNRDCCDACSEGGNLICCDKCPASFHLTCHDPPLDDEDIPLGLWLCHKCRVSTGLPPLGEVLKKAKENSSESVDKPVKEEPTTNETPTRGRSRASSSASMESNKSRGRGRAAAAAAATTAAAQSSGPVATASVASGPDNQSALDTLIAAASCMNPTQFDLPRELVLPINFPGTDRAPTRGKKASASKRSRTHELDNGLVPLPAKTCFECRKSCKRAPLLACDYCPLLFHLDCLDPPLTSLPCGQWMCPNHVEQAIDEKLLTSLSVTQRVALWDKYTGPIDQDAVKTEFLQKTRRKNPPFRFKVKLTPRNRAKVPNSIKEMYMNRPSLIPTLKDVLRGNEIASRWANEKLITFEPKESDVRLDGATETEQEEWLSSIVALQTSIACHLSTRNKKIIETSNQFENQKIELKSEDICELDCDRSEIKLQKSVETKSSADLTATLRNGLSDNREHSILNIEDMGMSRLPITSSLNGAPDSSTLAGPSSQIQNGGSDPPSKIDDEPLLLSDRKSSRKLSPLYGNERDVKKLKRICSDKTIVDTLCNVLEDSLDSIVPDLHIDKLDERIIRLLALQRLQQLSPVAKPISDDTVSASKAQFSLGQKQSAFWPSPESGLKPRALLTPLNGSQPPMPIYYRVMEIGTGGDMDICLSYYGHCNYVTAKHAVIICDEVNRHYELMNYSEHGTTVDNVLYSCDFSEKLPVKEQPLSPIANHQHHGRRSGGNVSGTALPPAESLETEVEVPPLIQKIRAVVDKRRGVVREEDVVPEPNKMPADIGKVDIKCGCRSSSSSLIGGSGAGWEGTALLNHGSFIKFGCIQFTFSVLNFVSPPQRELSQESTCASVQLEDKGPIPSRILKRERDSTSSSTLTVSPSPPPDKAIQATEQFNLKQDDEDIDDDENDDDVQEKSESDREDDEDEIMEEDGNVDICESKMEESPIEISQEYVPTVESNYPESSTSSDPSHYETTLPHAST